MTSAWVDANVLIRFVVKDHPTLSARARALLARAASGDLSLRVAPLVTAELVWVLTGYYEFGLDTVADTLTDLLMADGIVAEERDLMIDALRVMKEERVSFIDAYLAETAKAAGEPVCTFDRDFERLGVDILGRARPDER
ncbi:MAG: PIN domain-containing protein [Chloroflexi bacterium]|nr:PIN domain-containing protein [Chloroflexota bacterium]